MRHFLFLLIAFALVAWTGTDARAADGSPVQYARDIAPILRAYCAGCHDDAGREGRLSVETFAQLRKGGEDHGDPIQPGKPDESFLVRAVEGTARPKMPPKDEPQVPDSELATLRRWIAEGAPGPERDVSILRELVTPGVKAASGRAPYSAAAYSRDGRSLALAKSGGFELWDTTHQSLRASVSDLPGKVTAIHFSPDGSHVVVATGITGLRGVAQLFEVSTGGRIREFGEHSDLLYDAEFSPDGILLATAGYDRSIRLWNVADGALIRTIDVHKGAIFDLAWHPDGKVLASASADETVKLWRIADGARLDTLNQAQGELMAVEFTPDGRHIVAAGSDKRIHLWRFVSRDSPDLNPVVHSRFAHENGIHSIALSSDGRFLLSSANDRSLKLWSLPDLELLHAYPEQSEIAGAVVGVPGRNRFLIARWDGTTESVVARLPGTESEDGTGGKPAGDSALEVPAQESVALASGARAAEAPSEGAATSDVEPTAVSEEVEPNDTPGSALRVGVPASVKGSIGRPGDSDCYRFFAEPEVPVLLEINAARSKSRMDSRIEILHLDGSPVEQVVLQATRDSWFTFRGKDSESPDDFRLHNWAEMELNEYLYANGEVVRLWLYPRGPDSGFKVYPGEGRRETWFGTTALTHALGEPAYVVTPFPAGSDPTPNGLPVYRLNYVNDDDPSRQRGTDSLLIFSAPTRGEYLARVTDVRGFGGAEGYSYTIAIRPPRPDFKVTMSGTGMKVSPGSGREILFRAERFEGFDGPIRIDVASLPKGFAVSSPIEIEAGQKTAVGVIHADSDAIAPDEAADKAVRVTAIATVSGRSIRHELGDLGDIQLGAPPKVTVEILPSSDRSAVREVPGQPLEFSLRPGETITARVKAVRHDFTGRIELGNEDSGRNLPHGVYVDNIGLNGLLIVEGQTEREFFITASRIASPGVRMFHLRARADDGQASRPVRLRVLPPDGLASASVSALPPLPTPSSTSASASDAQP
ncbi:MAG: c-type cytochrome domain-containing protein [Limisphaerales bacterium]